MTATIATSGFGTLLQLSDGASPAVFTSLAEISNLTGPNLSRNWIDATHMESADTAKEFIAGLIDIGEVTCDCNFLPGNATQRDKTTKLIAAASSATATYRVVWPDFGATSLTGSVDTGSDVWTTSTHGWNTAQPIKFSTTGSLPTSSPQIRIGQIYYAARASGTTFKVYPTSADAVADTNAIDFSSTGSGTHTVEGGTSWTFTAGVSGFPPSAPKDDRMSVSIAFKGIGIVTIAP